MLKVKDLESKPTVPKRTITVDCVSVEDGKLVDENGPIAPEIAKVLPEGVEEFVVKITVALPEEADNE